MISTALDLAEDEERVRKAGGWNRFAAWRLKAFNESGLSDHSPVFRVCRDLEARLGIAEGKVARPDYRDYLADLIEERFGSRYRFCEATGIDPGQLSRVFTGKADLSAELLRRALGALDAHIEVRPNPRGVGDPQPGRGRRRPGGGPDVGGATRRGTGAYDRGQDPAIRAR
jgi:transcriptional regulator with XRE-family HTH domain